MSAPAIYRIVDISYRNPTLVASAFVGSRYSGGPAASTTAAVVGSHTWVVGGWLRCICLLSPSAFAAAEASYLGLLVV
jgi:hypothetical protein